jgi:hypothetical protein
MIICIGNSHANFFTGSRPGTINEARATAYFRSYSIGPVIAYNLFEHHLKKIHEALKKCEAKPNDQVMLIVGEVDCRWHLPKRINDTLKPSRVVVEECTQRFFRVNSDLKAKGYRPIVWCGHPTTTSGHNADPISPIWGDCFTRNDICKLWRDQLIKLATEAKFPYLNIVDNLIDEKGLTRMEYFEDYCHLDYTKLLPTVIQKAKKQGLI